MMMTIHDNADNDNNPQGWTWAKNTPYLEVPETPDGASALGTYPLSLPAGCGRTAEGGEIFEGQFWGQPFP